MSKSLSTNNSPPPPPYTPHPNTPSPSASKPTTSTDLLTHITVTRDSYLLTTLKTHILPALQRNSARGLSRTSLALVVDPESTGAEDNKAVREWQADLNEELENDPTSPTRPSIPLPSPLNDLDLWREAGMAESLQQMLREELQASSVTSSVVPAPPAPSAPGPQITPEQSSSHARPWKMFRKRSAQDGLMGRVGGHQELRNLRDGYQVRHDVSETSGEGNSGIVVSVRIEDVPCRRENEFGIWDTRTGVAILVWVDLGVGGI